LPVAGDSVDERNVHTRAVSHEKAESLCSCGTGYSRFGSTCRYERRVESAVSVSGVEPSTTLDAPTNCRSSHPHTRSTTMHHLWVRHCEQGSWTINVRGCRDTNVGVLNHFSPRHPEIPKQTDPSLETPLHASPAFSYCATLGAGFGLTKTEVVRGLWTGVETAVAETDVASVRLPLPICPARGTILTLQSDLSAAPWYHIVLATPGWALRPSPQSPKPSFATWLFQ
jgi:hypothetical protein